MIPREEYMKKIMGFLDKPVIKVLTGMRRSGKSSLLELLKRELILRKIPETDIIFINFESIRYEGIKDYKSLYAEISEKAKNAEGKLYILLDEKQEVEGWEKTVNSLRVDYDADITVTGSNAKLLSGELATLLTGRYVEIKVYPLSYAEYLKFAHENAEEVKLENHFENFLRFGGLPGIHRMTWDENIIMQYLSDIYNSVLLRDVVSRYDIRDTALLESIVKYLMDNIGNTFSAKTISDFIKNQGRKLSVETVYNYLEALENACLIHKVSRYDIKGKKILETLEKYYLTDLGLRHSVLGFKPQDISGLLENIVYLELMRRGYSVHIGKQGAVEVDFIADKNGERTYFQVCYILTEDNMEREFRPLLNIRDHNKKVVLSTNSITMDDWDGVKHQNIIDFLLAK